MPRQNPYTKTWRDHENERKQPQQKDLGATFALLVFTIAIMLKVAHIY